MVQPKITVGVCTGGNIRAETVSSLFSNLINMGHQNVAPNLLIQIGGYVAINRNMLVATAIEQGSTHLMFVDADMLFPPDGIMRLLKHNKDIVAANYNVRVDPQSNDAGGPTVKMMVDGVVVSMTGDGVPDSLFKCYGLGTGFMLIKLDVFKKLKKPWFKSVQDKNLVHTTEDIYFCQQANKAGIKIYCDPTIKMGHIGSTVF